MNRTLVVLFLAMISMPLAGTLAGVDGGDAESENRQLTAFPRWGGGWKAAREYPNAVSHWFEDHFAGRARLVRWYGESRFFLLGVSPSSNVLVGCDGWLYYADDGGVDDYANASALSRGEVGAWHEAVVRAQAWLHARRVAYVFTIAPDKHAIYPEHVPATIRRVHDQSRMDQIVATLAGTGVSVVDLRPALDEGKTRERLYDLTDTHWNDRGAFIAYRQIIEAVRRQVPAIPAAWTRADFEATERETAGKDLAGMMGLKRSLRETELRLVPKRPRLARVVEPAGADPAAQLGRLVTEIPGSTLPRALILRDSFASRLVPFLSEHFSRAVYMWQNDFDPYDVNQERPDVVIQEIVGRHLYTFIPSDLVPH